MKWYKKHLDDPYPSKLKKQKLAAESGLTLTQVQNIHKNLYMQYSYSTEIFLAGKKKKIKKKNENFISFFFFSSSYLILLKT